MKQHKTITEHGYIYPEKSADGLEESTACVILPDRSFQLLCDFIAENEADHILKFGKKRGHPYLKTQNYVGVLETADGTVIEILPKIYRFENDVEGSRRLFLKMLSFLRDSPYQQLSSAQLKAANLPLLEVFIRLFTEAMQAIAQQGFKHHYVALQENQVFLKGKLLFSQHIRENVAAQHRFFVEYDRYLPNIAANRILKSCCAFLLLRSKSIEHQNQLRHFLQLLDSVPFSSKLDRDFQQVKYLDRTFEHYQQPLRWARVFLRGESFTNFKGKHLNQALLFPMERIFEDYVCGKLAGSLREEGYKVHLQHHQHALVAEHAGRAKFRLRPDLVATRGTECLIYDAKWKLIHQHQPQKNYQIAQSDMYQLFAYGSKYEKNGSQVKLFLVYPEHEHFSEFIAPFHYYLDRLELQACAWRFEEESMDLGVTNFNMRTSTTQNKNAFKFNI